MILLLKYVNKLVNKHQALSEVKDTFLMGRLKKSRGALFNKIIQEKTKENNIDLGINKKGS